MKKIGIISEFNRETVNYGNRLQAMAFYTYLNQRFPNYKIEYLYFSFWDNFLVTQKRNFRQKICIIIDGIKRRIVDKIIFNIDLKRRLDVCDNFSVRNMNMDDNPYTWERLCESSFDTIVVGSDVVWAQGKGKLGRLRFLDFKLIQPFERVAYAASFGRDWIPQENVLDIQRCLTKFKNISVREKSSVKLLKSIGIDAVHVVDPTMLLNKTEWAKYEKVPVKFNEIKTKKFIFTYLLGSDKKNRKNIEKWAVERKFEIVTIPFASGKRNYVDRKFGNIQIIDCSPENWLWLIHHAEFVFTDSFHGAAFSTIFEKKLVAMERGGNVNINNRMIDFLTMIGQEDKIVPSNKFDEIDGLNWDYKTINSILEQKIIFSKNFIDEAL